MTNQTAEREIEDFVKVGTDEYCVELRPCESGGYWFNLTRYNPESPVWGFVANSHIPDASNQLDALRAGFREPRSQRNSWLRNWATFRQFAKLEPAGSVKGSKRSYYTKHANESKALGLKYAAEWKLSKAIWKELTKLNRI
jgi:hypothetical protein